MNIVQMAYSVISRWYGDLIIFLNNLTQDTHDFLSKNSSDIKDGAIIFTLVLNMFFFYLNRRSTKRATIEQRLADIQKQAMSNPYLEDPNFTNKWSEFIYFYKNGKQLGYRLKKDENYEKFLTYEQYCEMIFNLLFYEYEYSHGNISKMNSNIAFGSWIKNHKLWYKESIYSITHNTGEYGTDIDNIVNFWLSNDEYNVFQKFLMKRKITRISYIFIKNFSNRIFKKNPK